MHRCRRSKNDAETWDFSCQCGKSFLSYPALYIHIKTKHPEIVALNQKRGRGRARKYCPNNISFETKYDSFFDNVERKVDNVENIDI